jgi:hypothetical protein
MVGPGGGSNEVVAKTFFRSRVTKNEATPFLLSFFFLINNQLIQPSLVLHNTLQTGVLARAAA